VLAARKGVEWIISNQIKLPFPMVCMALKRIFQTTYDLYLINKFSKIFNAINAVYLEESYILLEEINLNQSKYTQWDSFDTILKSYENFYTMKKDNLIINKIQDHLNKYEEELLNNLQLCVQLRAVKKLERLGFKIDKSTTQVEKEILNFFENNKDVFFSKISFFRYIPYILYIYDITHVIFNASDDCKHYVDSSRYVKEKEILMLLLDRFLEIEAMDDKEIDMSAELLICLKLLQTKETPTMIKMQERLLQLQNFDGSWGKAEISISPSGKIHHTGVVILAVQDLAPSFRSLERNQS
jgi:hypothetical protein